MKMLQYPVRKFFIIIVFSSVLTAFIMLLALYLTMRNTTFVLWGLLLIVSIFAWGAAFLIFFQKKLSEFTDSLCQTLDGMINGGEKPEIDFNADTSLARISHKLERLYNILQMNHIKIQEEKVELQSLVSDISHQTKTPIANLKMINDTLLTRTMPQEKKLEFLRAMGSQLDKLDFLIQAMVKTSRLETGVIALEKKRTLLADTLTIAVNGVLAPMEKKQIALSVDCPEDLAVLHDRRWTSEAIYNLLDNAVKYTPIGGNIGIAVQSWEMYLKIDVSDTGRGIPEKEQATIFKRFYREDAVHDIDGIGIGLYLSREIITMQGGYIKVVSTVGKGSVFSLFLPHR